MICCCERSDGMIPLLAAAVVIVVVDGCDRVVSIVVFVVLGVIDARDAAVGRGRA